MLGREKVSFLHLPTPLEYLANLSAGLGVEFYVKRDDLTGFGGGGNKLRKLEYFLKDARDKDATMFVTVGGVQTNHGRLTAAVAAKFGMKCAVVSIGDYPGEVSANVLLSRLMGSDLIIRKSDGRPDSEQYDELVPQIIRKYEERGEKVYFIPLGGSNDTGALGYYECAVELTRQAHEKGVDDARVFTAVGSAGTYMGLYCGLKNEGSSLRCTGIAISPFDEAKEKRVADYFNSVKKTFGLNIDADNEGFDIEKSYVRGGYNEPSKEVRDAICLMARKEALLLDPCYTGKCFAAVVEMIREDRIRKGERIILMHTGGMPGLYTKHHRVEFEKELMDGITLSDWS